MVSWVYKGEWNKTVGGLCSTVLVDGEMACMEVPGSYWAEVVGKASGIMGGDGEEDVYVLHGAQLPPRTACTRPFRWPPFPLAATGSVSAPVPPPERLHRHPPT